MSASTGSGPSATTADELEDEGENIDSLAGVAGIRFWF